MPVRSSTPFFGRAYSLTISPKEKDSKRPTIVVTSDEFEPSALRITFDVAQYAFSAMWQAEIVIWNADGEITDGPSKGMNLYQAIIREGDMVKLCAAYQADYPPDKLPVIWEGPIFYTIQDRPEVTDRRLRIQCLIDRAMTTNNFINETINPLTTQFDQARFIAEKSLNKISIDARQVQTVLDNRRENSKLPRAKTYFGNPHNYLTQIADMNSFLSWFDGKKWNLDDAKAPIGKLVATYAPVTPAGGMPVRMGGITQTLIGQPQQTQLGVTFKVLLDPAVQVMAPLNQVRIPPQYVRQAPIAYPLPEGQGPPVPLVDNYVVVGVRFVGDTRGNAWYSEITGLANVLSAVQLLGELQAH